MASEGKARRAERGGECETRCIVMHRGVQKTMKFILFVGFKGAEATLRIRAAVSRAARGFGRESDRAEDRVAMLDAVISA